MDPNLHTGTPHLMSHTFTMARVVTKLAQHLPGAGSLVRARFPTRGLFIGYAFGRAA